MVRGHAGQSFRLACPCGQATEGLKTPGYSKTVQRTGCKGSENLCNIIRGIACRLRRERLALRRHECVQGHAGQSFRLARPLGKNPGEAKDPRLLRDRPSDGAALVRENLCEFHGETCIGSCGFTKGIVCRL